MNADWQSNQCQWLVHDPFQGMRRCSLTGVTNLSYFSVCHRHRDKLFHAAIHTAADVGFEYFRGNELADLVERIAPEVLDQILIDRLHALSVELNHGDPFLAASSINFRKAVDELLDDRMKARWAA